MERDINKNYLAQIQKYPLLSALEESELSRKIETGDKEALNCLVNSNLRLVVSIAHKFANTHLPLMDLVQEGNMGLLVAAEKFNYSFKTRFSTYAYPWIVQYMLRYANSRVSFIALPHRKDEMIRKIQSAASHLFQQTGHEATSAELAVYLGIPEEQVVDYMRYNYVVSSLDVEAGDDDSSVTMGDLIADQSYAPEQEYLRAEEKARVRSLMDTLPGNERQVLWYRYNFDGSTRTKTLREISKMIGVSPEAVRQTELRALRHLKQKTM